VAVVVCKVVATGLPAAVQVKLAVWPLLIDAGVAVGWAEKPSTQMLKIWAAVALPNGEPNSAVKKAYGFPRS
jgi:hypothetical protein